MPETRTSIRFLLAALGLIFLCGVALNLKKRPQLLSISSDSARGRQSEGYSMEETRRLPRAMMNRQAAYQYPPVDTRFRHEFQQSHQPPTQPAPVAPAPTPPPTVVNKIDTSGIEDSLTDIRKELSELIEKQHSSARRADQERITRLENEIDRLRDIELAFEREPVTVQVELKSEVPFVPAGRAQEFAPLRDLLPLPSDSNESDTSPPVMHAQEPTQRKLSAVPRPLWPVSNPIEQKTAERTPVEQKTTERLRRPSPPATLRRLLPSGRMVTRENNNVRLTAGQENNQQAQTKSSQKKRDDKNRFVFVMQGVAPLQNQKRPQQPQVVAQAEVVKPKEKPAKRVPVKIKQTEEPKAEPEEKAEKKQQQSKQPRNDYRSNVAARIKSEPPRQPVTVYQPVLVPYSPLTNTIVRTPAISTNPSIVNPPIPLGNFRAGEIAQGYNQATALKSAFKGSAHSQHAARMRAARASQAVRAKAAVRSRAVRATTQTTHSRTCSHGSTCTKCGKKKSTTQTRVAKQRRLKFPFGI